MRSFSHFEPRYFAFAIPAYLVLVAAGMRAAAELVPGKTAQAILLAALAAATAGIQARGLLRHYDTPPSLWREAVAHVNSRCAPGDAVVILPPFQEEFLTRFYPFADGCRQFDAVWLSAERPLRTSELFRRHPRLWIIARTDPSSAGQRETAALRDFLASRYSPSAAVPFRDLSVQEYRRRADVRSPEALTVRPHLSVKTGDSGPRFHRLVANVFEILEDMPRGASLSRRDLPLGTRLPRSIGVVRLGPDARFAGSPSGVAYAGMLVWSGAAVSRGAGPPRNLSRGDWSAPPDREHPLQASASGAVLLLLPPGGDGLSGPHRRRLAPGESSREEPGNAADRSLFVVLEGPLTLERPISGLRYSFREGDIVLSPPGRTGFRPRSGAAAPAVFLRVPLVR